MHDGLQDGGEGRDPDPGADEHGVLRVEDQVGRRAEGTIDEDLLSNCEILRGFVDSSNLQRVVDLTNVGARRGAVAALGLCPGLGARAEQVVGAVLLRDPVQDEVVGGAEVGRLVLLLLGDGV